MHGLTAHASKDWDIRDMYINEQGRIVFTKFSLQYLISNFEVQIIQNHKGCSAVTLMFSEEVFPDSLAMRDWNSLIGYSPSLKKKHLIDIYNILYISMSCHRLSPLCDLNMYSSGSIYAVTTQYLPRDYLVVGKIPVVPTEQAVAWGLFNNSKTSGFRYDLHEYPCVLLADFALSVDQSPFKNHLLVKDNLLGYSPWTTTCLDRIKDFSG